MQLFKYTYLTIVLLFLSLLVSSCSQKSNDLKVPLNEIKGTYEPQLNFLNLAIEKDDDDEILYFRRAKIYYNMYLYNDALADIQKAISLKDNKSEFYLLHAQIQFELKNLFSTIKSCEKAEALGNVDPELSVLQARVYWAAEDKVRSNIYLKKAESIIPYHSYLNLLKGKIAEANKDTAIALQYFLKSFKQNNQNYDAIKEIIHIYYNRNDFDSTMIYTLRGLEIKYKDPQLHFYQGDIYKNKNLVEAAKWSFNKSLSIDSNFANSLYALGDIYYRDRNYDEALNYFKSYIQSIENNIEVYKKIIDIEYRQGRELNNIPYYEKLVILDSNNVYYKYALQSLYRKAQRATQQEEMNNSPQNPINEEQSTNNLNIVLTPTKNKQNSTKTIVSDTTVQQNKINTKLPLDSIVKKTKTIKKVDKTVDSLSNQ